MLPQLLRNLLIYLPVHTLNHLIDQNLLGKAFICLGWLCILVMLTSIFGNL